MSCRVLFEVQSQMERFIWNYPRLWSTGSLVARFLQTEVHIYLWIGFVESASQHARNSWIRSTRIFVETPWNLHLYIKNKFDRVLMSQMWEQFSLKKNVYRSNNFKILCSDLTWTVLIHRWKSNIWTKCLPRARHPSPSTPLLENISDARSVILKNPRFF